MEVDGGVASAARRRRERRLRSWWRHEQQSVRMALNAAAHHSAVKVAAGEENTGLRAPTTFSAGRPGVLTEPEPQGGAVTVGYVAAPGPLLEVASMAGGDSVDGTALRFLVHKAIDRQKEKEEEEQAKVKRLKEEKEERRMLRINAKVRDDLPLTGRSTRPGSDGLASLPPPLHRPQL